METQTTYNLYGYEWKSITHTKYDNINYQNAYFGNEGVSVIKHGSTEIIDLTVVNKPTWWDGTTQGCYSPNDHCDKTHPFKKELCCGELYGPTLSYGTYQWKVNLNVNNSKYIWPALWLCGKYTWPPEIDLVEGYSNSNGSFRKNLFCVNLNTNLHIRENLNSNTHIDVGAKSLPSLLYKFLHKQVDTWKLVWTPDYIKFYFNNFLIRKVTNKKILRDLSEMPYVYPIMNMMVLDKFILDETKPPILRVYDFSYESLF